MVRVGELENGSRFAGMDGYPWMQGFLGDEGEGEDRIERRGGGCRGRGVVGKCSRGDRFK